MLSTGAGFFFFFFNAHLPKITDPAGPVSRPWAKITFEEGTDHLDDKWASGQCQKVRAGEDYYRSHGGSRICDARAGRWVPTAVFTAP